MMEFYSGWDRYTHNIQGKRMRVDNHSNRLFQTPVHVSAYVCRLAPVFCVYTHKQTVVYTHTPVGVMNVYIYLYINYIHIYR